MFREPRNRFQGIDFASLCSLASRYDNPICRTGLPGYIGWPWNLFLHSANVSEFGFRLHRLAESGSLSIPWNRFLGSLNVYKYCIQIPYLVNNILWPEEVWSLQMFSFSSLSSLNKKYHSLSFLSLPAEGGVRSHMTWIKATKMYKGHIWIGTHGQIVRLLLQYMRSFYHKSLQPSQACLPCIEVFYIRRLKFCQDLASRQGNSSARLFLDILELATVYQEPGKSLY